jgi:predicted acylesterase/phospholipase RssA
MWIRGSGVPAALTGALVGLLAACGSDGGEHADAPRSVVEVYDSAGVRIVVNHADTAFLPLWTVDTVPVFRAGHHLDDMHHQFVQIEDARLLSNGRVVVSDVRTHELRLFDSDGGFLRLLGRSGEGPGEFRGIRDLAVLPGDSIMAWDMISARLTFFDPDGELVVRVARPEPG